ncbi:molecular chaperone [Photobacterium gaetbulicola]|uniref:Molecular chaperone n=2 Tax=Photobacterium gaetbulicola TaxID=1295392 RepID=A0A0B9GH82_9GAMM|nr:flagellar export chaperone FlgN [Photobacterium gaetbulicola]AJR09589.1 putative chaperone FlgN [Photobacterium gaetbulicola Gung47]KHT64125.1 molecular chaperone [Photobacterium gaetbulicola]PSU14382.1 molecular chaperone [Photobacterium gaetbulicola]
MSTSIEQLLEQQQVNLTSLTALLAHEQQAIVARQSELILECAQKKSALIDNIKLVDHQLAVHPEQARLAEGGDLAAKVASLREMADDCKSTNDVNGEALMRAQLSFHKLNNLLQQSRGKHQMTYTSEGMTQNTRTLGTDLKA